MCWKCIKLERETKYKYKILVEKFEREDNDSKTRAQIRGY